MSAKDVIVKVLRNNTNYVTQDDISSSPMVKTPEAIFEEDIPDVAQQILDSLPRLSRDGVKKMLEDYFGVPIHQTVKFLKDIRGSGHYGMVTHLTDLLDQICSLVPAGEMPKETVIARGKVEVWKDECDCRTIDRVQVGDIDIALEVGDYDGKTIEIVVRGVTE